MKLKNIGQMVFIGLSMFAIAACSSMHKHKVVDQGGSSETAMNQSAESSGLDNESNFGEEGNRHHGHGMLAKRTYYFDFDKSNVRASDKPAILANADYLAAHPHAKVTLEGHTDPRGSREYNVGLGERRGNSVMEILTSKGVNPDQIRVVSYGAQKLAADGRTESAYKLDRRVKLVVVKG